MNIEFKGGKYILTINANDLNTIRKSVHDAAARAESHSLLFPTAKATRKEKAAAKREAKRIMDLESRLESAINEWRYITVAKLVKKYQESVHLSRETE